MSLGIMDLIPEFESYEIPTFCVAANGINEEVKKELCLLHVLGIDGSGVLFVTSMDDVYALGRNTFSRLGLTGITFPEPVKIDSLCGKHILEFSTDGDDDGWCAAALTKEGHIYYWGETQAVSKANTQTYNYPQRQYIYKEEIKTTTYGKSPKLLEFVGNISVRAVQVKCLKDHFLLLTSDYQVFEWGQCGSVAQAVSYPRLVRFPIGVAATYISGNSDTFMAVTRDKKVYTWLKCSGSVSYPSGPVQAFQDISVIKICFHSGLAMLLTEDQEVYSYASGAKCLQNFCLTDVKNIEVSPYWPIFAATTKKRTGYIWGKGGNMDYGQPVKVKGDSLLEILGMYLPTCRRSKLTFRKRPTEVVPKKPYAAHFNKKEHSNLTIIVNDEKVYVSKGILIEQCSYFNTLFEKWDANEKNEVTPNIPYDTQVYIAFLKYFYTGLVEKLDPPKYIELFLLANEYEDVSLKEKTVLCIQDILAEDNVVSIYEQCLEKKLEDLSEICETFIIRRLTKNLLLSPVFKGLTNDIGGKLLTRMKSEEEKEEMEVEEVKDEVKVQENAITENSHETISESSPK